MSFHTLKKLRSGLYGWFCLFLMLPALAEAVQHDIVGPPGSGLYGSTVTLLPNGNSS